jgi:hypothetical protein
MGMAKRNYSKRSKKIEPAVQTIYMPIPVGGAVNSTIDLSQVASLVNRRFYRQGINWAVAGFKLLTPAAVTGEITLAKLPNTWVLSNSWEKGFRTWSKMNREALSESDSVAPKFLDFKIYMDQTHHAAGFGSNLLPVDASANAATAGEWQSSKIVIPVSPEFTPAPTDAINEYEIVATGASFGGVSAATGLNAVSLIEGYAASRALPDVLDPNTPDDAQDTASQTPENWLQAIFNDGTGQSSDVIDIMQTENEIAPYPFEGDGTHLDTMYPGGANQLPGLQVHDLEFVTGTTIGGTTRLKGGNFPCGLVRIQALNFSSETTALLLIDLIPGNHRGYLCESMTEM